MARGFEPRERTFQPPMGREFEDCRGRMGAPGGGLSRDFSPRDLPGLVAWLRADMGITLVGSKVSSWADQSGQGHDLSQSTDANRPTYVTGALGGQPVLRFGPTATDIHMLFSMWAQGTASTVFLVLRMRTKGAADYQLFLQSNTATPSLYLGGNVGGTADRPLLFHTADRAVWGTALTDLTAYMVKWSWDFNPAASDNWYTQVNNATEVVTNIAADQTSANWQSLGHPSAQDLIADVSEIAIYNRRLTAQEDTIYWNYARGRYQL